MKSKAFFLGIFALLSCLQFFVYSEKLHHLSFDGPYEIVGTDGKRKLNGSWEVGGHSEVKEHFVRLTPDRQSKRGHIWNPNTFGKSEFSAIIAFRISGQGQRWFGDGIGLWFTHHPHHVNGDNHGFTEKYVGIGIILDTFHNTDHKGGHKDVTILVNDGTKDLDTLNEETKIGCDASMRYHEGNDGFNPVYSSSRLKIQVKGNHLTLKIDEKATGEWTDCYDGDIKLPGGWATQASIGITAATGSLADNHDVLRMSSYSLAEDPDVAATDGDAIMHNLSKDYDKWFDYDSCGTDCRISILQKKMKDFKVEYEHRLTDLKEKTDNTIQKLKDQEHVNELKIIDLEHQVSGMVDRTMEERMDSIGNQVNQKIEKKLNEDVVANSGGWKTPFFLLCAGLCGGGFFLYKKYQHLRKTHLL